MTSRVAFLTPPADARTGVAHYASVVIPALRKQLTIDVVNARPETRDQRLSIYQLGNNPHHEWIYEEAMRTPGVAVLHDLVLHHLIVEMTLARGDAESYVAALQANHGEPGAAWARARVAGLHSELGNFLFPASIGVASHSRAVIVHNEYAASRLRSFGVSTPIHVVPHPFEPFAVRAGARETVRARHGLTSERVIGLFGFLTSAKRSEVVLAAFAEGRKARKDLRLLVVGEPSPNIDVESLRSEGVIFTGYVDEFDEYYAVVDRLVNLRYPTAGETSGTLIRAFAAGKPVAVSDYAQFAELPDDIVVKIPFGEDEVARLAEYFVRDVADPSARQRQWLEENATVDKTVDGYLRALDGRRDAGEPAGGPAFRRVPLFPKLELVSLRNRTAIVRNTGDVTLRAREYGDPAYRMIVKSGEHSRWLELPGDVAPGQTATVDLPESLPPGFVTFHHALESIAMLEPEAWGRGAIQ